MFAKLDKQDSSRAVQTSLATAGTNFTKPRTKIRFGLSTVRQALSSDRNVAGVNMPPNG